MEQILIRLKEYGFKTGVYTPEQVAIVQKKFAEWFPFENLDVICGNTQEITPEFLQTKLFHMHRGGLCYEINALLFYTLKELGFDVQLGSATVNNQGKWALAGTHVMVLLTIDGRRYIVDGGFGNRLALYPLEINGKAVTSQAGTFRVKQMNSDMGSIAYQSMTETGEWGLHYAFEWVPADWQTLNEVKDKIHNHPHSPFNRQLIIANIIENGTISINENRILRKFTNGKREVSQFTTKTDMLKFLHSSYSSAIAIEAEKYIKNNFH